jgi:hypothetical protein
MCLGDDQHFGPIRTIGARLTLRRAVRMVRVWVRKADSHRNRRAFWSWRPVIGGRAAARLDPYRYIDKERTRARPEGAQYGSADAWGGPIDLTQAYRPWRDGSRVRGQNRLFAGKSNLRIPMLGEGDPQAIDVLPRLLPRDATHAAASDVVAGRFRMARPRVGLPADGKATLPLRVW